MITPHQHPTHRQPTSRRRFLAGSTGIAAAVVASGGLAGCSTAAPPRNTQEGNAKVQLPTFIEYEGAKPDLPGTEDGVMAAYLNFPADPPRLFDQPPGSGGEVSAVTQVLAAQLERPDSNEHWKALNAGLGASLKVSGANGPEFDAKVQTMLAGDDLPDLLQITSMPRLPDVLAAKFTDLTDQLGGDKIKDYPALAAIATASWKTTVFNGGIFGVPAARGGVPNNLIIRKDLFDENKINPEFESAEELHAAARALTNPNQNRWAFGTEPSAFLVPMVSQMLGVPNGWSETGGAFASSIEHPGTKQSLEFVTQLWKEGLIHPDSIADTTQNSTWFRGRRTAMIPAGLSSWLVYVQSVTAEGLPASVIDAVVLPKFDGGGVASYWRGRNSYSFTALKQAEPERITELLKILDWMASPFGTQEYLIKNYGVEGSNYRLENNNPVAITGNEEYMYFLNYIVTANEVLYQPGRPDVVKRQHELQAEIVPDSLPMPTEGLYSESNLTKGATLAKDLKFAQNDIVAGRKPLSSWDDAVASWQQNGGDEIRKEYEAAFAAAL